MWLLILQTNNTEAQILWSTVICPTCPLTNDAEHFVYPSTLSCPDGLLVVLLNGAVCASCPGKCQADEGSNSATSSENFLSVRQNEQEHETKEEHTAGALHHEAATVLLEIYFSGGRPSILTHLHCDTPPFRNPPIRHTAVPTLPPKHRCSEIKHRYPWCWNPHFQPHSHISEVG